MLKKARKRTDMAKAIKVYGTTDIISGELLCKARQLGLSGYSRQVRVICGATSMAEANRMCDEEGLYRTFKRDYTSITGNKEELELAGNGGIFIGIPQHGTAIRKYYSIKELKENNNGITDKDI